VFQLFTPSRIIERVSLYAKEYNLRLPPLTVRSVGTELGKRKIPRKSFEVHGKKVTVYAVLKPEVWSKRNRDEWRKHYLQYNGAGEE
jgi:hypothetical protein